MKKMNSFMRVILFAMLGFSYLLTSCTEDENLSKLTGITSFSVEDFNNVFEIDQVALKIFNKDSLPYGTDAKTLVVNFSAINGVKLKIGEVVVTPGMVIDCSGKIMIDAVAEDKVSKKSYELDVRISKVNPDAVSWIQKAINVFDVNYTSHKAFYFKDKMWMIVGKIGDASGESILYNSTDGATWTKVTIDPIKFPAGTVQNIFINNNKLFVVGFCTKIENWGMKMPGVDNNVWSSTDGITWDKLTDPFVAGWNTTNRINSAAFSLNNKIILVGGNNTGYGNINGGKISGNVFYSPAGLLNKVTTSNDGIIWETTDMLPAELVLRRYSANWMKAGVMYMAGGQGKDGKLLSDVLSSTDGITWTIVTENAFASRMKMQVIFYNEKFYMIGGQLENGLCTSEILVSDDGSKWDIVEDIKALPSSFTKRAGHSVFLDKDNNIWILGGFTSSIKVNDDASEEIIEEVKTDVWSGKLNKL